MNAKKAAKALWEYISDAFEPEEIKEGFDIIKGFDYEPAKIDADMIDALSDEKAQSLLFDINYMAVNELFGGDFGTWNEVLVYSLEFDDETMDFLNY